MPEHLHEGHSLISLVLKQLAHEVLILSSEALLESNLHSGVTLGDGITRARERCLTVHELVQENTEGPCVNRVVIPSLLDHFWRHILQCTAIGLSFALVEVVVII